jgi:hypothetical protein
MSSTVGLHHQAGDRCQVRSFRVCIARPDRMASLPHARRHGDVCSCGERALPAPPRSTAVGQIPDFGSNLAEAGAILCRSNLDLYRGRGPGVPSRAGTGKTGPAMMPSSAFFHVPEPVARRAASTPRGDGDARAHAAFHRAATGRSPPRSQSAATLLQH